MAYLVRSEATRPHTGARKSIHLAITPQMDRAIDELLATGLFGFSRTDVARRLLAAAILRELPALDALRSKR